MTDRATAAEAREWLVANWHGTDDATWRRRVLDAGWAAPTWPSDAFGRGLDPAQAAAVVAEFAAVGAPGAGAEAGVAASIGGTTVVEFGSPELKAEVLPKLLTGEWANLGLLYSEPGNGSDLAGLQTRAERDGDVFVVNGQKVWTTGGHIAHFGLLIARTDIDVPKHAGISFFIIPMDLPGIEVRPITQMTGDADFNEVFLTDVPVPAGCLVGELNDGWRVLQTALREERRVMGAAAWGARRAADRAPIFAESDDLVAAARAAGKLDDPAVRQEIMRIHSWRLVNSWTTARLGPAAGATLAKLANSRILHSSWALKHRLLGTRAMVYDKETDAEAFHVEHQMMWSFINSIGGGSDQIQRNIIGERLLGLPKGHEPDRGVPFRDIWHGGSAR